MFEIHIKSLTAEELKDKVRWYNDEDITKHLHYEEKFTFEKSLKWLEKINNDPTRNENVIQVKENGQLKNIGIIGLFNIDRKHMKAGFYITIGEKHYQGKGLAKQATILFLKDCFARFNLEKIYLFTDADHVSAQKLYEKLGFKKEGLLRRELFHKNKFIDRLYYGILKEEFSSLYL